MPSAEIIFTFLAAAAIFAYMPGPSTLYAAAQTIAGGRRSGWLATLGIHVGGYVHVVAAALGISILFSAVPILYTMIKLAGACYLIWLGIQLLRSRDEILQSDLEAMNVTLPKRMFWQSFAVEVLNPKTAIFYIAFLPQFTDPVAALPLWGQLLVLGTIVNIMFSSADILCVILSSKIMSYFRQARTGTRIIKRTGGSILVGLEINLAFTRQ